MEKKVLPYLKRKKFSLRERIIIVGVSGGPDSLALLHFLWKIKGRFDFTLIAATVDHMFRGEQSFEEAKFVEEFCQKRQIPFEMKRIDVPKYMAETGKSSQIAARECRYQFFADLMEQYHADYLALGHHADDQIETVLMRLTRGSTGKARAGIPFQREFEKGMIFRPFLCLKRDEIEEYCDEHGLAPRRDPSNEQEYYVRNRFRKHILPFLKKENPQMHEQIRRFSEEILADEDYLLQLTKEKMNTLVKEKAESKIILDIEAFQALPMPLQRRSIQLILNYLYKKRPVSLSALHIEDIIELISCGHSSGRVDLPEGFHVIRSYDVCTFSYDYQKTNGYRFEMTHTGILPLPNGGYLTLQEVGSDDTSISSHHSFFIHKKDLQFPVVVRTRCNGDRMTLKGMNGTKKVKDIFIDQKLSLQERDSWPIVTDANNHILWIPCIKKSHFEPKTFSDNSQYYCFVYSRDRTV